MAARLAHNPTPTARLRRRESIPGVVPRCARTNRIAVRGVLALEDLPCGVTARCLTRNSAFASRPVLAPPLPLFLPAEPLRARLPASYGPDRIALFPAPALRSPVRGPFATPRCCSPPGRS